MATVGNVVPITVISGLIGFLDSDPDRLLAGAFDSTAMLAGTITLDELLVLMARTGDIGAWIADQLNIAAKNPGADILGCIARGIDSGVLAAGEGHAIVHTLLSAGGESTTSLLGNAVRIMAENQDMQQQLRRHPDLLPAFIEEVLRLESPFRYHMRSIPRDTTLGDVDIPAGASLLLLWGAANRDAAEHHQPDEVCLDRRVARHHVAFGRGIHHCVGAPLARIEARVVLSTLLQHTRSITLDPERASRWVPSLMVRRHEYLPVHLTPA
jgi:cytochrome P450